MNSISLERKTFVFYYKFKFQPVQHSASKQLFDRKEIICSQPYSSFYFYICSFTYGNGEYGEFFFNTREEDSFMLMATSNVHEQSEHVRQDNKLNNT